MLRIVKRTRSSLQKSSATSNTQSKQLSMVPESAAEHGLGIGKTVVLTPIGRYVPTDSAAFLVEGHRLTGSESLVQGLSSVFPWLALLILGASPFLVMKYNLEKVKSKSPDDVPRMLPIVPEYKQINFADMPEIIERRSPTLVVMYTDNFHSMVYLPLFRDLSKKHSICVYPASSCDESFLVKYPAALAPRAQLIVPGNKLIEYDGPWNATSLAQFLATSTPADTEAKLKRFEECVFTRRFVEKNTQWTLADSLASSSLDDAIVRCEARYVRCPCCFILV